MEQILRLSPSEQAQYFREAAAQSSSIKSPNVIEKDFWVCWALEKIFGIPEISPHLTFKGGTSLSKCYHLINRFSEDCDLTINKELLSIFEDTSTIAEKSKNQRNKYMKALANTAKQKVNGHFKPLLISAFKMGLSEYYDDKEWRVETAPDDLQTLLFHYPSSIYGKNSHNEYILSTVKLEFGARGDNHPSESKNIIPYVYNILETNAFAKTPKISVNTLTAERTFWEKITLLHVEHHRPPDKPIKNRVFRHYYDVVMLHQQGITDNALKKPQLLNVVLENKKNFFYSKHANYETAKIGTLNLLPNNIFEKSLKQDCENMAEMFFGEPPDFYQTMEEIKAIEKYINQAH